MKIYIKNVGGLTLPKNGSELSAGHDIVATSEPKIVGESGEFNSWKQIDYIEYETNLFISPVALTFHTLIYPRSSISKYNLMLANGIGLVDNDYRGMILCRFKYMWQPSDLKHSIDRFERGEFVGEVNMDKIYKKGDKIAQLVVSPTVQVEWVVVDDLNETKRGIGGFGSTDNPQRPEFPQNTLVTEGVNPKKASLENMYKESGGVSVKTRYIDEIKARE